MLTNKQKRFLRREAHRLKAIFQVGKDGVSENLIKQIDDALEARELIKVSVLQNCEEKVTDVAEQLRQSVGAQIVQIIGRTIVFYKRSENQPKIELPG